MRKGRPANVARALAVMLGERQYIGAPCRKGHGGNRYVSTAACIDCAAANSLRQIQARAGFIKSTKG